MSRSPKGKPAAPADADDVRSLSFEDAIARLESIIDRIESGEIGLEESVRQYELGVAIRKRCEEILAQAEQKIVELTPESPGRRPPGKAGSEPEAGADEDAPF